MRGGSAPIISIKKVKHLYPKIRHATIWLYHTGAINLDRFPLGDYVYIGTTKRLAPKGPSASRPHESLRNALSFLEPLKTDIVLNVYILLYATDLSEHDLIHLFPTNQSTSTLLNDPKAKGNKNLNAPILYCISISSQSSPSPSAATFPSRLVHCTIPNQRPTLHCIKFLPAAVKRQIYYVNGKRADRLASVLREIRTESPLIASLAQMKEELERQRLTRAQRDKAVEIVREMLQILTIEEG